MRVRQGFKGTAITHTGTADEGRLPLLPSFPLTHHGHHPDDDDPAPHSLLTGTGRQSLGENMPSVSMIKRPLSQSGKESVGEAERDVDCWEEREMEEEMGIHLLVSPRSPSARNYRLND